MFIKPHEILYRKSSMQATESGAWIYRCRLTLAEAVSTTGLQDILFSFFFQFFFYYLTLNPSWALSSFITCVMKKASSGSGWPGASFRPLPSLLSRGVGVMGGSRARLSRRAEVGLCGPGDLCWREEEAVAAEGASFAGASRASSSSTLHRGTRGITVFTLGNNM